MSELEPTRTYSNLTATDVLRRLLDERGVEHYDGTECTLWGYEPTGNGTGVYHYAADEIDSDRMTMRLYHVTPEQAIAATLGATDAKPTQAESSGTCHITDNGPWGYPYVCSACGASFDPDVNNGEFNHCPNCGRRIEQ